MAEAVAHVPSVVLTAVVPAPSEASTPVPVAVPHEESAPEEAVPAVITDQADITVAGFPQDHRDRITGDPIGEVTAVRSSSITVVAVLRPETEDAAADV